MAPAGVLELAVVPALAKQTTGILIDDRNYWAPAPTQEWQSHGVELLAPYRSARRDPHRRWSTRLTYRIDTVFDQRVDHCQASLVP